MCGAPTALPCQSPGAIFFSIKPPPPVRAGTPSTTILTATRALYLERDERASRR